MSEINTTISKNVYNNISLCNSSIQQRHRTTPTQLQFLESYFQNIDDFPDSNMRKKIAQKLNMPSKSVHICLPLLSETLDNVSACQHHQQQHYLTNFASLKLPPLRNFADKSYARRHKSSKDITLPPLHLAVPQILLGSRKVVKYHMNNYGCKTPTQSIHYTYNIHSNQFSQPPLAQSKQQERNQSNVVNDDSEPTVTAKNVSKLSYCPIFTTTNTSSILTSFNLSPGALRCGLYHVHHHP
ncbi:6368_t:CDS:2 [Funneliformis geosporum]|uniref:3825_t:CDS:1 n=1 Tax=Funneliformis geosporum TaxID=1117311 RepID=A0A9W4SF26_9GLOM|nr:6368_t:CDS:2 [Funneliformis geosporum]CAI2166202.1 3825_t:CDS:2 [Funneliformis geosporum]